MRRRRRQEQNFDAQSEALIIEDCGRKKVEELLQL